MSTGSKLLHRMIERANDGCYITFTFSALAKAQSVLRSKYFSTLEKAHSAPHRATLSTLEKTH